MKKPDDILPPTGSTKVLTGRGLESFSMDEGGHLNLILEAIGNAQEGYLIMQLEASSGPGKILHINQSFCRMTGYVLEELTGKDSSLLWQGPSLVSFLKALRAIIADNQPAIRQLVCHRKDGSSFWAELEVVPLDKADRGKKIWVGILHDISDRKQMEQTLVESQMRLNGLLNSLSDLVWSMDVDQEHFIYLNPAAQRIFGYPVEDFFHNPKLWRSIIQPEDRDAATAAFDQILTTGGFEIDYRIVRSDGEVRWLRNKAHVICDPDGKPLHVDGLANDITSHKSVEARMERMANFPQFNPNPIYELTAEGELTYFNEPAGVLAKALGAEKVEDILPSETNKIVIECLRTGQSKLRVELPYGDRTISWSFFPIPNTKIIHCYAGEITERIRLEAQLRQSEKLKSVGQLAGGVAHDFNNILTIIQGFTNLLLSRQDFDDDAIDQLKQVAAAANKAADLTKQLLMFSRRQVLQTKNFNLNLVVTDLAKMLERLLGEDIHLTVKSPDGDVPIEADQGMLEQVVVNLSSNARDAMPRGGVLNLIIRKVEISATTASQHPDARPGLFACLTAVDTGFGMDRQTISRVFEPFFTTKLPGKGTGLGLSTVYGIVKQHEGWVVVESELGKGTTFNIYLPLAKVAVSIPQGEAQEKKPLGGTETILVVEDEAPVRVLLRSILQSVGYKIIEAKHGLEALRMWDEHRNEIDMLLTDLVMPGTINGIDLADRLLSDEPELKVIYSSGYSADVVGEKMSFDAGTNFLPKPYTPAQLLRLVRSSLDAKS